MSTRVARVVRGLIVAAISLIVAAGAHASGGGQIGAVGFAIALAFSSLVSITLSGRAVSRARMTAAVIFSQAVFHLLFGIGAGPSAAALVRPSTMMMTGMGGSPLVVGGSVAPVAVPFDGWMWAAHGAAAIVTIAALVKGQKAFWRLADWVFFSLNPAILSLRPSTTSRAALPATTIVIRTPASQHLLTGTRRRGPPASLVIA